MKIKNLFQKIASVFLIAVMISNIIIPNQLVLAKPLVTFTDCASQTEIPTTECDALVALYNNTDGANWYDNLNWLQTDTPCSWFGVVCYLDNSVTELHLEYNDLSGPIPTELGNLTNLVALDVSSNQLTGSIPPQLGNLTHLKTLQMYSNQLTGSIPTELGNLSHLKELLLDSNLLTGSIPTEIGSLINLNSLHLNYNQLTGNIPDSFVNLLNLTSISFNCGLTSTNQSVIDFLDNLITNWQCLPIITDIYDPEDMITGGTDIYFYGQNFDNVSSITFGGVSASFTVNYNSEITVTTPAHVAGVVDIVITNLYGTYTATNAFKYYAPFTNCASQTEIPTTECDALVALYNSTDGQNWYTNQYWMQRASPCSWALVTCALGTHVTSLNLYYNSLVGTLPTEMGNLTYLTELNLSYNELNGAIPTTFGNLTNLTYLDLSSNGLTGSIPTELAIPSMQTLYLDGTTLTGEIPASFTNMTSLYDLTLSCGLTSTNPTVISFIDGILWSGWDEPCPPVTQTFTSNAAQDGWILESSETSGRGGALNSSTSTFSLGDDSTNKQYRGILSFNTGAALPDNAIITNITLKVKKQGISGGGNPVSMFNGFMVDIKRGFFGTTALQLTDFQNTTTKIYGPFKPSIASGGWYNINLTNAKAQINKLATYSGLTQIRLRFQLDDNNNLITNKLILYSGNAGATYRPQLVIQYYLP